MKKAFISYSHHDQKLADRLKKHLKTFQIETSSNYEIPPGANAAEAVERTIDEANLYVLILSIDHYDDESIQRDVRRIRSNFEELHKPVFAILSSMFSTHSYDWLPSPAYTNRGQALTSESKESIDFHLAKCARKIAAMVAPVSGTKREILSIDGQIKHADSRRAKSRVEMVGEYIESSDAGITDAGGSFLSFDLTLYNKDFSLWFDYPYFDVWNHHIARKSRARQCWEFQKRPQIQLLPYNNISFLDSQHVSRESAKIKSILHAMLISGRSAIIRFGELPWELRDKGEYGVVNQEMLAETPGIHLDEFDTRVVTGNWDEVQRRFDALNSAVDEIITSPQERSSHSFQAIIHPRLFFVAQYQAHSI